MAALERGSLTLVHVLSRYRAVARCPMRCALRIRVDPGRLGGGLGRYAVGIAGGRVVSDALRRSDWRGVVGFVGEGVVWVALCCVYGFKHQASAISLKR